MQFSTTQFTLATNTIGTGSITLSPVGGVYDSAAVVTVTAVPGAGFQFDGWVGDLTGTVNPTTITMDANKTVIATFSEVAANQFTLAATVVGSGSVALNPPGGVYDAGTVVTLTASADAGFQFDGWSGDITSSINPTTITVDSNQVVTSTFTPIVATQFTLTANSLGLGSVILNPAGGAYDAGTVVTVTAAAGAGSQFDNWAGDITGSVNPTTITMDANKTVTAIFSEIVVQQFTLNLGVVGSGSVTLSPAGGVYDIGTVVTLSAAADAGNTFNGWSGDLSGSTNPITITMNSDKNVSASFISTGGGGGGSGPVVYEETITGGATELAAVSTIGNVTASKQPSLPGSCSYQKPVKCIISHWIGIKLVPHRCTMFWPQSEWC